MPEFGKTKDKSVTVKVFCMEFSMESSRVKSGHRPYSVVDGDEYHPYDISVGLLQDIYDTSELHAKTAWRDVDENLIRGYNFHTRKGEEKSFIIVIGVMTDEGPEREYRQFTLRLTHSRIPEEILSNEKTLFEEDIRFSKKGILSNMDYHLSVVLWPWKDGPNLENYVPALCSPKNYFMFPIINVNRKRKTIDASVDFINYSGIAPPHVYDTARIANMFHEDWGSSVITRYEPDEEKDILLSKPKIIRFGRTEETDARETERYMDRRFGKRRSFDYPYAKRF